MEFNTQGTANLQPQVFGSWEEIALALFALLDNIDTASDIAKDNEAVYRSLVRQEHQKRFRYAQTDGQTVLFNVKEAENAGRKAQLKPGCRDLWKG